MNILQEYINNSVANQWHPSLPLPQDIFKSDWPYVPVDFEDNFQAMHEECLSNDHRFVGHRQLDRHLSYNHEGWAAITLHGIDFDKTEHWPQYGFKSLEEANYHWTSVCEYFPKTVEFIKRLGYAKYDRVRIMKLAPQGYIMPHTDGEGRIFGPLNIAINNPEGCGFYFKDWGQVPFKQGRGCFLDIGNEHIVWNKSDQARYHIIVHGSGNYKLFDKTIKQLNEKYAT